MEIKINNWILDDVKSIFSSGLSQDDLIIKISIMMSEYGRSCILQYHACTNDVSDKERKDYALKFNKDVSDKIKELGGTPRVIEYVKKLEIE